MPVAGIDHVALPTDDAERLLAFYKALGFTSSEEEEWRAGEVPHLLDRLREQQDQCPPGGVRRRPPRPIRRPRLRGSVLRVGGRRGLRSTDAERRRRARPPGSRRPDRWPGGRDGAGRERLRARPGRQPGRIHLLRRGGGGSRQLRRPGGLSRSGAPCRTTFHPCGVRRTVWRYQPMTPSVGFVSVSV